jgi:hypothetical protein
MLTSAHVEKAVKLCTENVDTEAFRSYRFWLRL